MRRASGDAGNEALGYLPQLDGLRALAVSAVVLQHYGVVPWGASAGVHLFFVLSGFLITGILLASRQAVEHGNIGRGAELRHFYIRRTLRIFPLYYLVILVALAVNAAYAREYAPWLLTYTINLKMAAQGWYLDHFAHFWSLAVEEQFYLVWPWLILLLPRRALIPAALGMIAIGPLFRLYHVLAWNYWGSTASGLPTVIATPTALDSLGVGALLAMLSRDPTMRDKLRRSMRVVVPLLGLAAAVVLTLWLNHSWELICYDTVAAVVFAWLIYGAARGFHGLPGYLLGASPVVFVGKISYGIYVYHELVPPVARFIALRLGLTLPEGVWGRFLVNAPLTLLVATLSWYALERPINSLKRHFRYLPDPRQN